jgi:Fe-Mn family superoxide dismutase
MTHSLPKLPYDSSALEPYIDRETMALHHGKHHAAYVNNLNAALETHPDLQSLSVEKLLGRLHEVPSKDRSSIRNNAGGHANHSLFWQIMSPQTDQKPAGEIDEAIRASFGSFDAFRDQFSRAALSVFGSGWAWLIDRGSKLMIETTPNQDSPFMEGRVPLLGLDVWEHAYYLRFQNRRADYIEAWWHVVNWVEVNRRLRREALSAAS